MVAFALRSAGTCVSVILLFFLLAVVPAAAQQQPAGRATAVLGLVEAVAADGEVRRLSRGDPVFEGETLRTGPSGRAQIRFTDRGVISLRPDTVLGIDEYQFDTVSPAASRQTLQLDRGGFRTRTGGIASANRAGYRVQSPVAVVGIRGTVFEAHQQPGGALLVGASQGGVEVESLTGVRGRIGVGESYNFLRVNPDGSIDFLLEPPAQFSVSPELDEGEDDGNEVDALDAGDADSATLAVGGGSAESPAGLASAGELLVDTTSDPEAGGIVAPAQQGSGAPPTTVPIDPSPGEGAVLSAAQIAALLGDDRIGLALGVSGAVSGEDGGLEPGPAGIRGGIATVNSPLLALSSGRVGLGSGIGASTRQALLEQSDIVLLADSGSFSIEEDVAGVGGLVWGRFLAPVTVFVDRADASRTIELDRDLLFVIGTPTGVASLEGTFTYELLAWDAVSSGLEVSDVTARGILNLATGQLTGFLDVFLGESSDGFILLAEYGADVLAGVLENVVLDLSLLELATETSVAAEGTLSGFFTGDAGAFLQLAFDYRVPSRSDADVYGLALLEREAPDVELPDGALTPEELAALGGGLVYIASICCFELEDEPSGVIGGTASDPVPSGGDATLLGVNLLPGNDAAQPLDPGFLSLPPDAVIRRGDASTVDVVDYGGGLFGFTWDGSEGPALAFDTLSGEPLGIFDLPINVLVGPPTPTANLVGGARYELTDFSATFFDELGIFDAQTLSAGFMSFNVDFASGTIRDGLLLVPLFEFEDFDDFFFDLEDAFFAQFTGELGLANGNAFVEFDLSFGGVDVDEFFDLLDLENSLLGGFFTGADGGRFAAAFRLQTLGFNGLDENPDPFLLIGTAVLGRQDLSLSAAEAELFGNGLAFVGAECCERPGAAVGLATMASGDAVLGLFVDASGEVLGPLDPAFGVGLPGALIRRAGAFTVFDEREELFDLFEASDADITEVYWAEFFGRALVTGSGSGLITDRLSEDILFYTAQPSSLAALTSQGFTTFSGAEGGSGFRAPASGFGFNDADGLSFAFGVTASFNVNLANGEVFAGHLFVIDDFIDEFDGENFFIEELGFEVFFDGQVGVVNGNSFAEMRLLDGSYRGLPLDLNESELLGFFTGESGVVFLGSYSLQTRDVDGPIRSTAGIFGLSNLIDPELRLSIADVSGWDRIGPAPDLTVRPSFGLAVFDPLFMSGAPAGGLLLGRANQVIQGEPFVLGANSLAAEFSSEVFNTRRSDFFAQPFEFILRQGPAAEDLSAFDPDARPMGAPSFAGFEVSWGAWFDGGEGDFARIQPVAGSPAVEFQVGERVLFASVVATPAIGIPRMGSFRYEGGPLFDGPGAAFAGSAGGNVSGVRTGISDLSVGFELDFTTGNISGGQIEVDYFGTDSSIEFTWIGEFSGFLNGAVTDLRLDDLTLRQVVDGGIPSFSLGSYGGTLSGLLTGPAAERHAGGFAFQFEAGEAFESTHGLWVIERFEIGE